MKEKGAIPFLLIVGILILGAVGFFIFFSLQKPSNKPSTFPPQANKSEQIESRWQEKGVVITGQYADAEVVDLGNGQYRMYFAVEPEVPGNNLEVFSSLSTDGINWTREEGIRKTFATFPDVIKLPDGTFRMYFQNAGVIKSAVSSDGLNWRDEAGIRIDKSEEGFDLENVAAQSATILADGTYAMVYRGTINEPYQTSEKIPNKDTQIYFWAKSSDGLTFEKKGLAIDSRNDTLFGAADGAEWVKWEDQLRVYFWSYGGVYHVNYEDGVFSKPAFDFTNKKETMVRFPPNPPTDPTLIKIGGKWFMYFGQHTKGIYYATY